MEASEVGQLCFIGTLHVEAPCTWKQTRMLADKLLQQMPHSQEENEEQI